MSLYDICPDGLLMHIYAQPGARKSEFSGVFKDRVKIKISCPPVDGKANKELEKFLACYFSVPKSKVVLLKGDKSRNKTVLIKVSEEKAASAIVELKKNLTWN